MRESTFDAIVVGSGIAGLRAAIAIAPEGRAVAVVTKDGPTDSASDKAQGGLAAVLSEDDEVELHYRDTLNAGDGLCTEAAVQLLVEEGPAHARELIDWGARFDLDGTKLALGREGAHSKRRILHAQGDSTGREIVRALVARARNTSGIILLPHMFSIDLIMAGGRCAGLLARDERNGDLVALRARAVVLATGGAGRVYRETTNPPQATGDGMAMAYRAGCEMMDLEFVQFHPTALSIPGAPRFLLSEAMRGDGGRIVNRSGETFMNRIDDRGDLAPRDVVARGIVEEIRRTGTPAIYLDMSGLDPGFVRGRFPTIAATCARFGIDIATERIPISPCAHYMMGGVKTDLSGRTSIPGLYAAGEVACTGVHGANRLASNSLLEGLVFGARAGLAVLGDSTPAMLEKAEVVVTPVCTIEESRAGAVIDGLARVMWENVGILRDRRGLEQAVADILELEGGLGERPLTRVGLEGRNMLYTGRLIAESALRREESRGSHHRLDFPRRDEGRGRHSIIAPGAAAADLPRLPVPEESN